MNTWRTKHGVDIWTIQSDTILVNLSHFHIYQTIIVCYVMVFKINVVVMLPSDVDFFYEYDSVLEKNWFESVRDHLLLVHSYNVHVEEHGSFQNQYSYAVWGFPPHFFYLLISYTKVTSFMKITARIGAKMAVLWFVL